MFEKIPAVFFFVCLFFLFLKSPDNIYFHFVFKRYECIVDSHSQNIFLTDAFNVFQKKVISYIAVLKIIYCKAFFFI